MSEITRLDTVLRFYGKRALSVALLEQVALGPAYLTGSVAWGGLAQHTTKNLDSGLTERVPYDYSAGLFSRTVGTSMVGAVHGAALTFSGAADPDDIEKILNAYVFQWYGHGGPRALCEISLRELWRVQPGTNIGAAAITRTPAPGTVDVSVSAGHVDTTAVCNGGAGHAVLELPCLPWAGLSSSNVQLKAATATGSTSATVDFVLELFGVWTGKADQNTNPFDRCKSGAWGYSEGDGQAMANLAKQLKGAVQAKACGC